MRRSEPEKGISLSLKGGGRGEGISSDDEAQFPLPRFFPSSPETISLHFPQATSVSWLDFRSLLSLPYPKLGKPFIAQQKSHSVQRHGSFAKTVRGRTSYRMPSRELHFSKLCRREKLLRKYVEASILFRDQSGALHLTTALPTHSLL